MKSLSKRTQRMIEKSVANLKKGVVSKPWKPRDSAAQPATAKRRRRPILPEFAEMMKGTPGDDIQSALDEIRGIPTKTRVSLTSERPRRNMPPSTSSQQSWITSDPKVCAGHPCVRGLPLRVVDMLELFAGGESERSLRAAHPDLRPGDLQACVEFAALYLSLSIQQGKTGKPSVPLALNEMELRRDGKVPLRSRQLSPEALIKMADQLVRTKDLRKAAAIKEEMIRGFYGYAKPTEYHLKLSPEELKQQNTFGESL